MALRGKARLDAYERFVAALATRPTPVAIVRKASARHQRAIDVALRLLSFGGQDRYLTDYVTTLGHVIYVPEGWESREAGAKLAVLRHELVHVAQFERYGTIGMSILYGLLPFPIGLAYGRARLELEAYVETIRATAEIDGIEAATSDALREFVVERFVGPDYLFMWPFRAAVDRWVRTEQSRVREAFAGGLVGSRRP